MTKGVVFSPPPEIPKNLSELQNPSEQFGGVPDRFEPNKGVTPLYVEFIEGICFFVESAYFWVFAVSGFFCFKFWFKIA